VVNEPYSSVRIASDCGLDIRGSIPRKKRCFYSIASRPALVPTQLPINWVPWARSAGVKRPWSEAYHSPPFSVEYKNGDAIPPLLSTSSRLGA
jgi:hypothetical protein